MNRLPTEREVLADVEVDGNGCWLWQRALNNDGYARIKAAGEVMGHRVVYRVFRGDIPPGTHLYRDARCDRSCVNPDHLTPSPPRGRVVYA